MLFAEVLMEYLLHDVELDYSKLVFCFASLSFYVGFDAFARFRLLIASILNSDVREK